MTILSIISLVLLSTSFLSMCLATTPAPSPPPPPPFPSPKHRFYLSNVTAAYYTEENPFPDDFFGAVRDVKATAKELEPYAHPRVVVGPSEWNELIQRHANPATFNKVGTWSASFQRLSLNNGPFSYFVSHLADLETSGTTSVFTGSTAADFSSVQAYNSYRMSLKPLADTVQMSGELESHHLFLCAFWSSVWQFNTTNTFLNATVSESCVHATVAWAKVLMAHRTHYCNPTCGAEKLDNERTYIWNTNRLWYVEDDWYTCGLSLALSYDVLYHMLTREQRTIVRSAIALLVADRESWGNTIPSDALSPNAKIEPHRIFSNWAMYSSNIYLTNLAIQGENGFLPYAKNVLDGYNSIGFNAGLNERFEAMIDAFFTHSLYPDGSSFEDGYTYHTALREGSLAFVARQRRGGRIFNTPRFRNAMHSVAQMWEPWKCSPLVGHASGGGLSYPPYVALFRYAYPNGELPRMLWAQRAGRDFDNNVCRIMWTQTMMQMAFLGDEHLNSYDEIVEAPALLPARFRSRFPLAYVMTRRGLIVMRGSHEERAAYMHFDARPDAYFVGHDNADRGVFTFSALRQRWFDDHDWKDNVDSRKHSVLHVDGLSNAIKAPSATILGVWDSAHACVAAADLTYSYNVHWAQAWQGTSYGSSTVIEYAPDGTSSVASYTIFDDEPHTPWDLGWPVEDDAEDIGFNRSMKVTRVPHISFRGINEWRRVYRPALLSHAVRSTIMLRSPHNDVGVGIVVDAVGAEDGLHNFESYLVLSDEVAVDTGFSRCGMSKCVVRLRGGSGRLLDIIFMAMGAQVDYRTERFDSHRRIILRSRGMKNELFWMALHAHMGSESQDDFRMTRAGNFSMKFSYSGKEWVFRKRPHDHVVKDLTDDTEQRI